MARNDGFLLLAAGGLGLAAWWLYKQQPGLSAVESAPSPDAIVLPNGFNFSELKSAADQAIASLSRAPGIPTLQPLIAPLPVYTGTVPIVPPGLMLDWPSTIMPGGN